MNMTKKQYHWLSAALPTLYRRPPRLNNKITNSPDSIDSQQQKLIDVNNDILENHDEGKYIERNEDRRKRSMKKYENTKTNRNSQISINNAEQIWRNEFQNDSKKDSSENISHEECTDEFDIDSDETETNSFKDQIQFKDKKSRSKSLSRPQKSKAPPKTSDKDAQIIVFKMMSRSCPSALNLDINNYEHFNWKRIRSKAMKKDHANIRRDKESSTTKSNSGSFQSERRSKTETRNFSGSSVTRKTLSSKYRNSINFLPSQRTRLKNDENMSPANFDTEDTRELDLTATEARRIKTKLNILLSSNENNDDFPKEKIIDKNVSMYINYSLKNFQLVNRRSRKVASMLPNSLCKNNLDISKSKSTSCIPDAIEIASGLDENIYLKQFKCDNVRIPAENVKLFFKNSRRKSASVFGSKNNKEQAMAKCRSFSTHKASTASLEDTSRRKRNYSQERHGSNKNHVPYQANYLKKQKNLNKIDKQFGSRSTERVKPKLSVQTKKIFEERNGDSELAKQTNLFHDREIKAARKVLTNINNPGYLETDSSGNKLPVHIYMPT